MTIRKTKTPSSARFSWFSAGLVGAGLTALTLGVGVASADDDLPDDLPAPSVDEAPSADGPRAGKRGKRGKRGELPPGLEVCKEQVQSVCGDVEPGEGRIKACIAENQASFDPQCQEAFERRSERRQRGNRGKAKGLKKQVRAACEADVRAMCGEPESREALRACVSENRQSFSSECQDALKKAKKGKQNKAKKGERKRGKKAAKGERRRGKKQARANRGRAGDAS